MPLHVVCRDTGMGSGSRTMVLATGDLFFLQVLETDTGSYRCVASNRVASVSSGNATLRIAGIYFFIIIIIIFFFNVSTAIYLCSLGNIWYLLLNKPMLFNFIIRYLFWTYESANIIIHYYWISVNIFFCCDYVSNYYIVFLCIQ